MSRFFGLLAFLALLSLSAVSGQSCAGAGYDLSALANQQYTYTIGNYTYSVAPCGVVTNTTACPQPNNPATSFCQAERGYTGVSLAQYSAENATWYASPDGKTVTQTIQDGTSCGSFARETSIVFLCDSTATTAQLLNVSEVHTCYYTAYIATSAVCSVSSNAGATGPYGGVGSTWYDTRCGGGKYDLTPLSQVDLFWTPNATELTTVWFLRACGAVAHPNCSATAGQGSSSIPATQTAMLCQSDQTNPSGNDNAASFAVPAQQLWSITNTGLTLAIQDGESCGNFNRETTVNFVCNASATTAVLTGVAENPSCYYTATVQTNLVCAGQAISSGGGAPVTTSSSSAATGAVAPSSSSAAASTPSSSTAVVAPVASSTAVVSPTTSTSTGATVTSSTGSPTPGIINGGAVTSASVLSMVAAVLVVVAMVM